MIIALQGIQGSGKTTLVKKVCSSFTNFESMSIDDFYLPYVELQQLAVKKDIWSMRGNPGTHDIELILSVLSNFKKKKDCMVPVFDKHANQGRGDRIGWRLLKSNDVLLFEGWCLGFTSVNDDTEIDTCVKNYEQMQHFFDAFISLKPPYYEIAYKWREEAETYVRNTSKGMTSTEIRSFVNLYMPAYYKYCSALHILPHSTPYVIVELDENRKPINVLSKNSHPYLESICSIIQKVN